MSAMTKEQQMSKSKLSPSTASWVVVILLMTVVAALLGGCAGRQPPAIIYRYIVITPPDDLVAKCDIAAPPLKTTYVAATEKEQNQMLRDMTKQQYELLTACNTRLSRLPSWRQQQTDLYKDKDQPVK